VKHSLVGFCFLIAAYLGAQSPAWQWAQTGTCTTTDTGSSITSDNSGNVFTTGYYFGSNLTFSTTTLNNMGNYDTYIVKHDNNGNFLWATTIGGPYDDVPGSIACDNSGNVFVTGYYTSNPLVIGSYTLNNLGGTDIYVAKFDPNGNVLWAKSFGDNMIEEPYGITTDGSNVFVTGQFQSNTINFGTSTLTCNGGGDVFMIKYDNNGNELWGKGFGDTGLEIGYDITITTANDIYVTGSFKSPTLTFSTYTLTNMGGSDYFIIRYDASGNEIWAKSAGGNFDDSGTSIKEGFSGEIYSTGYFRSSTITFGASTYTNASATNADIFVVNYNSSGNETWSKAYGGNLDDISYGVVSDPSGNVFIGGHIHSSTVVFDTYTLTCGGVGDGFIAELNSLGTVTWAENEGGLSDDGVNDIWMDNGYNVLVAGYYYSSSIIFNPYTLNNNGNADLIVAKLLNPPNGIAEIVNEKRELSLYPNPSTTAFTIRNLKPNSVINIYDINGKELMRYEILNLDQFSISTQTLEAGIYVVSVSDKESRQTLKLSVVH
jgi:hypothetical protein